MKPTTRRNWSTAPMLTILRPVCPHCGHSRFDRMKTYANGDGSATKQLVCRACAGLLLVIVESPESGEDIIWPC